MTWPSLFRQYHIVCCFLDVSNFFWVHYHKQLILNFRKLRIALVIQWSSNQLSKVFDLGDSMSASVSVIVRK